MQCMLAGKYDAADYKNPLRFPVMASAKLDGVRALVLDGRLVSRQLKEIPNSLVQEMFAGLPDGLDGELILGDPTAPGAYRKTVSAVMGEGNDITGLQFHVFDNFNAKGGFQQRYNGLQKLVGGLRCVSIVPHSIINNIAELASVEAIAVDAGYEGLMVRSVDGPYKNGRSTSKEGYLLKVKRFEDAEATVVGVEELMHNGNVATTDALGHTERSSAKDGLTGRNALGALNVIGKGGTYDGVAFSIGTGFQGEERVALWKQKKTLIGKVARFKFFPMKDFDRPRFPVFLGWRDAID